MLSTDSIEENPYEVDKKFQRSLDQKTTYSPFHPDPSTVIVFSVMSKIDKNNVHDPEIEEVSIK